MRPIARLILSFFRSVAIVEDNPDDVMLLERALRKAGFVAPVHVCRDGIEAIEYMNGKGEYKDRHAHPFPRLMITDLKMPRCNGLELLKWIRAHPKCWVVPALIFSTSAQDDDVVAAYRLGANTYFQKPVDSAHLVQMLKQTLAYWNEATLPGLPDRCE